jgi:predicted phage terminase large subunit-like protein
LVQRQARRLSDKHPDTSAKLVEDKANGPAVIQSLQHEITGLIEVNPEGGKMSRAAAVSADVEAGNWYLPHPGIAPWVLDFLEECASFPSGAHDDQVDAWSQGGNYLRGRHFPLLDYYEGLLVEKRREDASTQIWRY